MGRERQARDRFGSNLVVAPLAAIVKSVSDTGKASLRILFDGTHKVPINDRIQVRDQERMPTAPDLKRQLQKKNELVSDLRARLRRAGLDDDALTADDRVRR